MPTISASRWVLAMIDAALMLGTDRIPADHGAHVAIGKTIKQVRGTVPVDHDHGGPTRQLAAVRASSPAAWPAGYSAGRFPRGRLRPRPRQSRARECAARAPRGARACSCLESRRPRIGRFGSRITAAATTGPASGPRPASSTPAISSAQCRQPLRPSDARGSRSSSQHRLRRALAPRPPAATCMHLQKLALQVLAARRHHRARVSTARGTGCRRSPPPERTPVPSRFAGQQIRQRKIRQPHQPQRPQQQRVPAPKR